MHYCAACSLRAECVLLQVVVVFIICTIVLLVLYMLFLLCLDPFLSRRPKSYVEQHNEEVSVSTQPTCHTCLKDLEHTCTNTVPGGRSLENPLSHLVVGPKINGAYN